MLPPKPEALPTQSIYLATLVRGRGTIRNISKMNLDDKWTRTDLTDQIAKLNELTFFHGVACESKHGWCVRHLKHHSNLSPTHASSISAKYECLGMFRASPQGSAWNSWAFAGMHVSGDSVSFSQGLHRG